MLANRISSKVLNNLIIEEEDYFDGSTKTTRYRIVSSTDKKMPKDFPNSPPHISLDKIEKMTNKYQLRELENKYDTFLDKYLQLLLLYNNIEEYLEIRDALTLRVSKLERLEKLKKNQEQYYPNTRAVKYDHSYQSLLPEELRLTDKQIEDGYMPYPNEPKEFKCGCLTMKYCSPTNKSIYQSIQLHSYCLPHKVFKKKEEQLESELKKVKKELNAIKRQGNSLDFEYYKNPKKRRMTKFPWKKI